MDIPIQSPSAMKFKANCGQTKHQKYGAYLKALDEKPEIVTYLQENIAKDPNGEILIRAVDMGPPLGDYFKTLGETAIHWGLKFALFHHGIFVSTTTDKEINPKTGKGYVLLRLRESKPTDKLSEELTKYLESSGEPGSDKQVEQCNV